MGTSVSGLESGITTYSSLLSTSSSSSSSTSYSSDLCSLLSDYASIKNGSYAKLVKAYYASLAEEDDSSSSSSSNVKDTLTATSASSAYQAAEALLNFDFSEDNIDEAYEAVSSFIDSYNSLITNATDSSNSSVQKQAQYLYDTYYNNYKLFASIGITLNADRTLSIDEDTFKSSSVATMKTLFNGTCSFADTVSTKASQIYRYASDGSTLTAKTYTSSGTYSSTTTGSTIDSTT